MQNLVASVDVSQPIEDQLKAISKSFPGSGFVPCDHSNKCPRPGTTEWSNGWIKTDNLDNFDFKTLGLVLGAEYLAIDCDGKSSINLLAGLLQTYGELPDTLMLSSNPGVRESYIFKINRPLEPRSIPTGVKEQLEFRTGRQYQIVGGLHPSGNIYQTNRHEISELPEAWYDYLTNTLDTFIPETPEQMTMWSLLEKLRLSSDFFGTDYESWLKIGMITHSVDSSDKGLELWATWSRKFPGYESIDDRVYVRKWDNFDAEKVKAVTVGSLYFFLQEKAILTEHTEALVKQLDAVVEKGVIGLLEKEAAEYKEMALTRLQIPMFASKIVQKVLKHADKYYIDYVISYLSESDVTPDDIANTRKSLETLYKADKAGLDVDWVLQDTRISYGLSSHADEYKIPKELLLVSFLTTYSSILSKKFVYNFNLRSNVIPTLFTLLVCEAAGGKSEVIRPFTTPLQKLNTEAHNKFIDDDKAWRAALENWKKMSKEQQDEMYLQAVGQYELNSDDSKINKVEAVYPEPKKQNPYLITDASFESIKKTSGEFDQNGLLIAPDEITDFLQTINQIAKQKDALDKFIAVWNGESTLRNRITGEPEKAGYFQCSLLSGIQTDRFPKFFDVHDPSGIMSRFLIIPMEPIHIPTGENTDSDRPIIEAMCEQLYIETQQKINFGSYDQQYVVKHTKAVLDIWGKWRDEQDKRSDSVKDVNKGFSQWLRRNPLYTARIALTLHSLRYVEGIESDLSVMSPETIRRAIAVSKWLTEKAQLVFNQSLIDNLESIDPAKVKIYKDVLKACKGVERKIQDFRTHSIGRRKDVLTVYGEKNDTYLKKAGLVALFQDIAKHGLGTFDNATATFTPFQLPE